MEQRVASLTAAPTTTEPNASSQAALPSGSPPASQRPEGLDEAYWDAEKASPKLDALIGDLKKAREVEAKYAERAKNIPETPDKYEFGVPKDFKLPDGLELNPDDPMVPKAREFAKTAGLTQDEFKQLVSLKVAADLANAQKQDELIAKAVKARDESLGPNGTERVDKLNSFFKAQYGEQAAKQLANTLFSKDIIEAWEKTSDALTRQNVVPFNGRGRESGNGGREDGRPDNWDQLSALDRRTWEIQQQQSRRA